MNSPIRLEALAEEARTEMAAFGSAALKPSEDSPVTLRFSFRIVDAEALEALRYARRSMLREEWTLGRDEGTPSLEDAIFSPTEVRWTVPRRHRDWCRQRLSALVDRANRTMAQLRQS